MDPTIIETLQGVIKQSVDTKKAALRESEVKVQNALQTTLQESEANVQNTFQAVYDRIDVRFRNQQSHTWTHMMGPLILMSMSSLI